MSTLSKQVGPAEYLTLYIDNTGKLYSSYIGTSQVAPGGSGSVQPANVPAGLTFTYCNGGGHMGLAVDSKGNVWTFGDNSGGAAGNGSLSGTSAPAQLLTDSNGNAFTGVIQAQVGFGWVMAVKADGTLWTWGTLPTNFAGNGTATVVPLKPLQIVIPGNRKAVKVQAAGCVELLCSDGTVWTWGGTSNQIVGTNTSDLTHPQEVVLPEAAIDIAGGNYWSYALGASGQLYGWGWYGGIFFGTYTGSTLLPAALNKYMGFPLPIASIYTSSVASYCILTDGSLWSWGDYSVGELGNGKQADQSTVAWAIWPNPGANGELVQAIPSQIAPGIKFTAVFTGSADVFGFFALDTTDNLYYAGRNKGNVAGNGVVATDYVLGAQGSLLPNSWDLPLLTMINPFSAPIILSPSPYCLLPANAGTAPCVGYTGSESTPVASAGANQTIVAPISTVILSGAGSTDKGGTIVSYLWTQVSGPNTVQINLASLVSPTVTGLIPGTYSFQLTVTDNNWNTATTTTQVTCSPAIPIPPPLTVTGVQITLYGTKLTIPAGQGTTVTLSNGSTLIF
jgi:hypothetical protein